MDAALVAWRSQQFVDLWERRCRRILVAKHRITLMPTSLLPPPRQVAFALASKVCLRTCCAYPCDLRPLDGVVAQVHCESEGQAAAGRVSSNKDCPCVTGALGAILSDEFEGGHRVIELCGVAELRNESVVESEDWHSGGGSELASCGSVHVLRTIKFVATSMAIQDARCDVGGTLWNHPISNAAIFVGNLVDDHILLSAPSHKTCFARRHLLDLYVVGDGLVQLILRVRGAGKELRDAEVDGVGLLQPRGGHFPGLHWGPGSARAVRGGGASQQKSRPEQARCRSLYRGLYASRWQPVLPRKNP
mmetsp:Transcript_23283/g.51116  ORF Transcript_23283/g.51116 Transcript_23283/m.51116 type:complete len:305 (+) Transcript_23283:705-1619(+)